MKVNQLVPFSQCKIWQQQKEYYQQQNIQAWSGKIPFYVTSNPTIANAYAQVIVRYWQDCKQNKLYKPLEPFYIIELGAGSGAFSFYLLKRLVELRDSLQLGDVQFVYVMTDFVQANIDFWRTHPVLQHYVQLQILDFARFDIEIDQQLTLLNLGRTLTPQTDTHYLSTNPFTVIANYVIDTLPQDVFRLQDTQLQSGMIKPDVAITPTDNSYILLPELDTSFAYQDVAIPYYQDSNLDAVLNTYKNKGNVGTFLIPARALQGLNCLAQIANQHMLLLVTDKGFSQHTDAYSQQEPDLAFHDKSFSMQVNLQAIGYYFQQLGGRCYHQYSQQNIMTSVYMLGANLNQLPETMAAITSYIDSISHNSHLLNIYYHIADTYTYFTADMIVSLLNASYADPQIFLLCFNGLLRELKTLPVSTLRDLATVLHKIAAHYYPLPNGNNLLANIGVFFQETGDYTSSIYYYQQSLAYFPKTETTYYNIGLCYYLQGNYAAAINMLTKTLQIAPDYMLALGWLTHIKQQAKIK
jgi:tetratricopeptide (TPR) repeat protein